MMKRTSLLSRTVAAYKRNTRTGQTVVPSVTTRQKEYIPIKTTDMPVGSKESLTITFEGATCKRFIWGVTPMTDDYVVT